MKFSKEGFKTVTITVLVTMIVMMVFTAVANGSTVVGAFTGPRGGDFALNNQNPLFKETAQAVGWHQPHYSTEIANHLIRNMRYNRKGNKSYVYIYANNGVIKAYFPIIGKCSSTQSSPTSLWHAQGHEGNNDTSNGNYFGGGDHTGVPVDSPQLDGSYGDNEPGVFCFVDEPGHPMITFNGDYIMTDKYIPLRSEPELIINHKHSGKKGKK
jgi:hypothetical protein